ncbi:MAG TPA: beta-ketoacyl synthase [Nitrospirae bacterium]|nr:beta-ketoacyl synthase [Nitrospirota bacterium]
MKDPVCIVGLGALTSVGLSAPATSAAVRAGISGFADHPYMINQEGDPYVVAMVPGLNEDSTGAQRYVDLAFPAIEETVSSLNELSVKTGQIPVIIGLPESRPGLPDDLSSKLSERVKDVRKYPSFIKDVRTELKGHSAGLMALERGSQVVSDGTTEFCLVGGVDSYIDPDTLDWIEDNDQLHKPSNAWGFIPGEAAAFCLICSKYTANKYKLPVKAQLVAISTAIEKNRIKTETVCIGQGLTEAVRNTIQRLPDELRINYTICDQNGEAYRADEFGFMLCRLSEHFIDPSDYMAPADCWGDVGAASGPLFINLITAAAEKGYAKGPHTLLWTSSEGGERTAAIFRADIKEGGMA